MEENQAPITINTIELPKLTTIVNDFICKTVNHLNKLSVFVEDRLEEYDKKMDDLEIMTTLLESKLNSLPEEITSTYPPLTQCNLDDMIPTVNIAPLANTNNNVPPEENDNSNPDINNDDLKSLNTPS